MKLCIEIETSRPAGNCKNFTDLDDWQEFVTEINVTVKAMRRGN